MSLTDEQLNKAINIFRRQTEADFFINKDARGFLCEQFDLWMYQYIFQEETIFQQERLRQLQSIQQTAYDIIDFISQFEDELCRVWEKPKFVRNVNYVVTLDKLTGGVLNKISKHQGANAQIEEWRELGMVDDQFSIKEIFNGQRSLDDANGASGDYKFLPLDTKHFKDLELEIIDALGNLDEALDGELVHSENWQALNTLQKRYKEKVKCIYIDPPFNLDSSDQFNYRTNYKNSCWATLLENRISLGKNFLSDDGSIFVRCDYNGNWIVRFLMDNTFNHELINEIQVNTTQKIFEGVHGYNIATNSLFWYGKSYHVYISPQRIARDNIYWLPCHSGGERKPPERNFFGKTLLPPSGRHWTFIQDKIDYMIKDNRIRINQDKEYEDMRGSLIKGMPEYQIAERKLLNSNWTDIPGYTSTTSFPTENSEKLLNRVVKTASMRENVVCDFFSGSGTTTAVAHKLGRKWIGVEMGEHFYSVILPRMKKVLAYDKSGISKEVKEYKGGGAFKYYALEQYEETLKNAHYQDGEQIEIDSMKSPFEQYVFFGDDKLAHAVKLPKKPSKDGKLKINLRSLYADIDIAESLSNVLGKPIRKRTADRVTFEDGTTKKTNPAKMTAAEQQDFISLIKPYLWWGE